MQNKLIYCGGGFDFTPETLDARVDDDWRVKVFLGNRDLFLTPSNEIPIRDGLKYVGPFYFETKDMDAEGIVYNELEMIHCCTHAIFLLDRPNCVGTVAEMIYAASFGKKIHIIYINEGEDKETESDMHTPCWYSILVVKDMLGADAVLHECRCRAEIFETLTRIKNEL